MNLYVLNKDFETVGIIDTYISLIWTERYKKVDDFELEMLIEDFKRTNIHPDYYIWQKNSKNMMVVEKFELESEDGKTKLKIKGRGLESILDRRVLHETLTIYDEDPDTILSSLINDNFTNPENEKRKTTVVKFVDSGDTEIKKLTYGNSCEEVDVLTIVLDICDALDLGIRAWFSEDGHFCYQFYRGTDRSWAQDKETWIVYSPKYNNLLSTSFSYDNTTYKNAVVVYGEDPSETTNPNTGTTLYWDRVTLEIIQGDASGLDLKEGVIDASDVSRWQGDYVLGSLAPKDPEDVTHGWKKLPAGMYRELLRQRAESEMMDTDVTTIYEAVADEHMQWQLGKDLYLGDIVQVVSEFSLESRCRVDSVIFSHDDADGIRYYPTFVSVDNIITQEGGTLVW